MRGPPPRVGGLGPMGFEGREVSGMGRQYRYKERGWMGERERLEPQPPSQNHQVRAAVEGLHGRKIDEYKMRVDMAMVMMSGERPTERSSIPTKTGDVPAKEVATIMTYGGVKSFKTSKDIEEGDSKETEGIENW